MTLDLQFGVAVERQEDGETYLWCEWPNDDLPQEDGCDPRRAEANMPRRRFAWGTVGEWLRAYPEIAQLLEEGGWNGSNDNPDPPIYVKPLLSKIEAIPIRVRGDDYQADRTKWLKFWAKRAVEEYGDKAILFIS